MARKTAAAERIKRLAQDKGGRFVVGRASAGAVDRGIVARIDWTEDDAYRLYKAYAETPAGATEALIDTLRQAGWVDG